MISYNHYASGAVGAFLYQRIVGIEAVDPGYKTFRVSPLVGGGLTWRREAPIRLTEGYGPMENGKRQILSGNRRFLRGQAVLLLFRTAVSQSAAAEL